MNVSAPRLEKCVDEKYPAEKSVVLRYRDAFTFGTPDEDARFKEALVRASVREGARIFFLARYKGVDIYLLDESSMMFTRTLKSIDGCVSAARCKLAGYDRVVVESGGNTGSALTAYGTRAGLEVFCFVPDENLFLLNSKFFASKRAHLVSVEEPSDVKRAARTLVKTFGLKHVPETSWRYEASRFRGVFILEYMLGNVRFDWIAQTISAAFGPIGIYWALRRMGKSLGRLPRFLGVQQHANCPMYRAWKAKRTALRPSVVDSTAKLLTRVMYDVKPHTYGTYRDLTAVLRESAGALTTIDGREFGGLLDADFGGARVRGLLADRGIEIGAEVVEKTGLIALAGTLKMIDQGGIKKSQRVLCCLTSGVCAADGRARPEFTIRSLRTLVTEYGRRASLG